MSGPSLQMKTVRQKTENQPTPISYSLAKWSLEGSGSTANHGYDYHSVSFHSRVSCDSQLEIPCPKSVNYWFLSVDFRYLK